MNLLDSLQVVHGKVVRQGRVLEEESVVGVPCWVLLRLEQCIEIPEGTLNEVVCWHLTKAKEKEKARAYVYRERAITNPSNVRYRA